MKKWKIQVVGGVVLCILIGFLLTGAYILPHVWPPWRIRQAFPGAVRQVLENSTQLTLYSLDDEPHKEKIEGHYITGKVIIKDKHLKSGIVSTLYKDITDLPFQFVVEDRDSWHPGMILRAVQGQRIVDVWLCYDCSRLKVTYSEDGHEFRTASYSYLNGSYDDTVWMSNRLRQPLNGVLNKAHIPIYGPIM